MDVRGRHAVVTGAGAGIGQALAEELISCGARVTLADVSVTVNDVADSLGDNASSVVVDCASEAGISQLLAHATATFGAVDLYFANAGIFGPSALGWAENEWDDVLDVNLRAHIRAAKQLVPGWQARGEGYFVSTASAAGLLTQIGQAGYSVTKHASLAFAEWLSIAYGDDGIRVSCLCPMGVNTGLLNAGLGSAATARLSAHAVTSAGRVLAPSEVARCVLAGVAAEKFLILPHPEVLEMYRMKGADYDRWLSGMRRYQRRLQHEVSRETASEAVPSTNSAAAGTAPASTTGPRTASPNSAAASTSKEGS